ncbi:MAG: tail protein X [Candidatus Binataceae bacterium]
MPGLTYITRDGDRWDLLAWTYYGDPTLYGPIIDANPSVGISPVLAAGVVLYIPIIEQDQTETSDLPPWSQ